MPRYGPASGFDILKLITDERGLTMGSQYQLKDVDSARQAILLNNFMRTFPVFAVLGLLIGGLQGFLTATAISALVSFCAELFSNIIGGGTVNTLYGFGRRTATLREQLAGDLSQVRYHKMNQNLDKALLKVDTILARDPNHPEALFLKAQLLWDGYEDYAAARECLVRIIKVEPDKNAVFNRWAFSFYRKISKEFCSTINNK